MGKIKPSKISCKTLLKTGSEAELSTSPQVKIEATGIRDSWNNGLSTTEKS